MSTLSKPFREQSSRIRSHRIVRLIVLLALSGTLASRGEEPRSKVIPRHPPAASVVRFEAARMPSRDAVWRRLPREHGEFVLSATESLPEWRANSQSEGPLGCILPPPNDFAVRAVTQDGGEFYLTFSFHAELVWVGHRLLDVPASTSIRIFQRVESVLKKQ